MRCCRSFYRVLQGLLKWLNKGCKRGVLQDFCKGRFVTDFFMGFYGRGLHA